jgi:iron complex transport system substrate-binding protein
MLAIVIVAVLVVASAAVAVIYLSNGKGPNNTEGSVSVVDDRGVTVNFTENPKRIVSLGSSFTEIIISLNASSTIIGVDDSSQNLTGVPSDAAKLMKPSTMSMEALVALDPDCVIIWNFPSYGTKISDMENLSIPVVAFYPKTVNDTLSTMARIGKLIGKDATSMVEHLQQRFDAVISKTKSIPESERPRVYLELASYGMSTVGNGSLSNELINLAGGLNIYDKVKVNNKTTWVASTEDVVDRNPQIIVVENSSGHSTQYFYDTFVGTDAVENSKVYRIDAGTLTTSPRIVDALEDLAHWFNPELFP